jgi:hypothetical protein
MLPRGLSYAPSPADIVPKQRLLAHLYHALLNEEAAEPAYDLERDFGLERPMVQQLIDHAAQQQGGKTPTSLEVVAAVAMLLRSRDVVRADLQGTAPAALEKTISRLFEAALVRSEFIVARKTFILQALPEVLLKPDPELDAKDPARARLAHNPLLQVGRESQLPYDAQLQELERLASSRLDHLKKGAFISAAELDYEDSSPQLKSLLLKAQRFAIENRSAVPGTPLRFSDGYAPRPPYRGELRSTQLSYPVRPDELRRLVPPQFELARLYGDHRVFVTVNHYVKNPADPMSLSYTHVAYSVPVTYNGKKGLWFLRLDENSEAAYLTGVDFFAYPKQLTDIEYTSDAFGGSGKRPDIDTALQVQADDTFQISANRKVPPGKRDLTLELFFPTLKSRAEDWARVFTMMNGKVLEHDFAGDIFGPSISSSVAMLKDTAIFVPMLERWGLKSPNPRRGLESDYPTISRLQGFLGEPRPS